MKTKGMVVTPSGTCLGFVEKAADGAWGITPLEDGLVRGTDVAESLADAKAYLVNRLTKNVRVTVNGESKQLRFVSEKDSFRGFVWSRETSIDISRQATKFELEFWDSLHGLSAGDVISVELPSAESRRLVSVLEGEVILVEEHKVSVAGTETFSVRDTAEQ